MLRSRFVVMGLMCALGVAMATPAAALTPEEEAILRQEAQALKEQARGLEAQADTSRENARLEAIFAFKSADGLEDQAASRATSSLQKWLQVADKNEARAAALREAARFLVVDAFQTDLLAAFTDEQAANERFRAASQRAAAEALLASGADEETQAAAKELRRLADKDEREGNAYESQAARLRKELASTNARVEELKQRAAELEAAP